MTHSFDSEIAKKVGLKPALILNTLMFWHKKNSGNEKNLHDGHYWSYFSVKGWGELFDYLTTKEIRNALDYLIDNGYVLEGNYNTNKYDRTKWYALSEKGLILLGVSILPQGQMDLPVGANGVASEGEPIPFINTVDNTVSTPTPKKEDEEKHEKFIQWFNTQLGKKKDTLPRFQGKDAKTRRQVKTLLATYSSEDIRDALQNCLQDAYHIETQYKYVTPEYFTRLNIFEKYLNQ